MRVLVVEDDPDLQGQLAASLAREGYAVDRAVDGEEGEFMGATETYDTVVLDLGPPAAQDGEAVEARQAEGNLVPVLILTARDAWHEKVQGIDAGADDYLAKPFRMEELLARVRALIRRAKGQAAAELRCGPLVLDTRTGRASVDGRPVPLTGHEYRVLSYLLHRKGQLVSRSELSEHVYAQDLDRDSNTIEVFVGRLRKKLGVDLITTVRGLGYRLEEP